MPRRELSLGRVLLIFLLGLAAGIQLALYFYDTFDDGVSEPLSGGIALMLVGFGLGAIAWSYRRAPA